MKKYKIILSSNSPRRKQLFAGLGLDFEVRVLSGIDESYPTNLPAVDVPQYIARKKAAAYEVNPGELIITADTVVIVDEKILGKPVDADDARRMLRLLSGRNHEVITGVCMTTVDIQHSFSVKTEVSFKPLSEDEITYYIDNYRPFDKAGAYGIQEWIGYIGVTSLRGSYFNVVGMPVQRIYDELKNRFGYYIG